MPITAYLSVIVCLDSDNIREFLMFTSFYLSTIESRFCKSVRGLFTTFRQ